MTTDQLTAGGPIARRSSEATRAAILRSARELFATHGYERTTIRSIAADAGIDPSMVMRYFGSKEQLFDIALAVDLRMPDLSAVPREDLPEAMVRHFLERWDDATADDPLLIMMRSAVTNERAAQRLHDAFAHQVAPTFAAAIGPETAARMGAVISAQLIGLGVSRYLIRLPAIAALTPDQVIARFVPAIRATLEADVPE
jgi:AcrR family transcriptional regulator